MTLPHKIATEAICTSGDVRAKSLLREADRRRVELGALLRDAIRDAGWTHDALAAHLDVERQLISSWCRGFKSLPADRLLLFPADVIRELDRLLLEHARRRELKG